MSAGGLVLALCAVMYVLLLVYLVGAAFWIPARTSYALVRYWSRDWSAVAAICAALIVGPAATILALSCIGQSDDFRMRFAVAIALSAVTGMVQIVLSELCRSDEDAALSLNRSTTNGERR